MASVNRVFLIGVVATPPVERPGGCEFVLGVPSERRGSMWLERVRVRARAGLADIVRQLRSAQPVYADGRLIHSPDGAVVEATAVMAVGEPPPDGIPAEELAGAHASPRAHDRAGHPRRLHAGTPRERVVWVRPTRVGEPGKPRHGRRRR